MAVKGLLVARWTIGILFPLVQGVLFCSWPRRLFRGEKRPEREANHSLLYCIGWDCVQLYLDFSLASSWQAETLLVASKGVGLEVNPDKTKHMLMSRSQKIGQKHSIKIANRSFEDVAKFKYLGTTLTDQNWMHEEIKSGLNSGNACCRLVHSFCPPAAVWERKG
jgi:hypothetical protein